MRSRIAIATLSTVVAIVGLAAQQARSEEPAPANPMAQNMKEMQESMTRLKQTRDPAKHRELMQQHMTQMQDSMKTMRGMMGGGMHREHGAATGNPCRINSRTCGSSRTRCS